MTGTRRVKPGYVVTFPNREQRASRITRLAVVIVLTVSALLILTVTLGGWSRLEGSPAIDLAWCVAYLVIAYYASTWARGLLPFGAGLGALMLAFAVIAETGAAGVSWTNRSAPGYGEVHSVTGGAGLDPGTLSALTIALAALQAVQIAVCARGFGQRWNVEYEIPAPSGDRAAVRT